MRTTPTWPEPVKIKVTPIKRIVDLGPGQYAEIVNRVRQETLDSIEVGGANCGWLD